MSTLRTAVIVGGILTGCGTDAVPVGSVDARTTLDVTVDVVAPADAGTDVAATDAGGCGNGPACSPGQVCAYAQGCTTLQRYCTADTSGDAVAIAFCGCDGAAFTTSQAVPLQPWSNRGGCSGDGGSDGGH